MLSHRFVLVLSSLLFVQGLGGAGMKLASGEVGDLAHNALHAAWGAVGLLVALGLPRHAATYAVSFGGFYVALAAIGAASGDGFPLFPLGTVDHVFHVAVGLLALLVGTHTRARSG